MDKSDSCGRCCCQLSPHRYIILMRLPQLPSGYAAVPVGGLRPSPWNLHISSNKCHAHSVECHHQCRIVMTKSGQGSDAPLPSCFCLAVFGEAFEKEMITWIVLQHLMCPQIWTVWGHYCCLNLPFPFPSDLSQPHRRHTCQRCSKNSVTLREGVCVCVFACSCVCVFDFWPISSAIPQAEADLCPRQAPGRQLIYSTYRGTL